MQTTTLDAIHRLTDADLVSRVRALASDERRTTADLIAHLAELDTRDIHLREGYSSLFAYCLEALHLSESETSTRIEVARCARRFPIVFSLLTEGEVSLTAVRLLAPHLNAENHRGALAQARGQRKSRILEIVASLAPRPDAPTNIRLLPVPLPAPDPAATAAPAPAPGLSAAPPAHPRGVTPPPKPSVVPLAPERYRLQMTISAATRAKLARAKELLRHAVPSGDEAAILDRALDALIAAVEKAKAGSTETPRPPKSVRPGSRHVPAAVRRAVWQRDAGRCAFISHGGHRCQERGALEYHHRHPFALGGEPSVANIELRCRPHNAYEGRLDFGRDFRRTCSGTGTARGAAGTIPPSRRSS